MAFGRVREAAHRLVAQVFPEQGRGATGTTSSHLEPDRPPGVHGALKHGHKHGHKHGPCPSDVRVRVSLSGLVIVDGPACAHGPDEETWQ